MTRAIDSIFLSWTGAPEKNSWADMIRWDLAEGIHETKLYDYEVLMGKPQPKRQAKTSRDSVVVRPRLAGLTSKPEAKVSVTQILDQSSYVKEKSSEQSEVWLEHFKIVSHGSLTHKLMQALKYSHDVDGLIERWFTTKKAEVLKALEFMKNLNEPPLAHLIESGHVEMGFSYKENHQVIDGQIDLWGSVENKVWIIDYKTGSTKYRDKAFSQLAYYGKALQKSGMISAEQKIYLAVIYPFSEKVFVKDF